MSRIKKTAFLSGAQIITTLSTLFIAAVLSRVLEEKADYGTYQQTLLVYTFLAPLLALGLPAGSFYFIPRNEDNQRSICFNAIITILFVSSIFGVFCVTLGRIIIPKLFSNPDLSATIPWLAVYGPATLILVYISSSLIALDRAKMSAVFTIIFRFFLAFFVVAAAIYSTKLESIVSLQSFVVFIGALFGLFILWRSTRAEKKSRPLFSLGNINKQLKYAVPLGLAAMLEGMALAIDRLMVSLLLNPEDYAVFANGAMEVPLIAAITVAAGAVMLPEIVRAFGKGDASEALSLWQLMVRRVTFILLPAGFLFYLVSQELMVILYSEKFKESVEPFRIYMLMLPARVAYFGLLFQGAGKTGLVLFRAIITLFLNAIITYFLVLKFGMAGAAWGTVAVVWLFVVPYCILVCSNFTNTKWYKLLPYKYIFKVAFISAVVALTAWYLSDLINFKNIILIAITKGTIYGILIFALMFTLFRKDCFHIYEQLKSRISAGRNENK